MILSLIVAADEHNVIGGGNKLLWKLPADMKHFRTLTTNHTIIMGRKTAESIGRALPNRRSIVVTRDAKWTMDGCEVAASLDAALQLAAGGNPDEVIVIGGGEIYAQAMARADKIHFTRVHGTFEGDVFFPEIDSTQWKEISREEHSADADNPYAYTFITYERASH